MSTSTPDAAAPLLSVADLSIRIDTPKGPVRPVDCVSFSLASGRTLGIVGESGCGKSMLCRALIRLLPAGGHIARKAKVRFNGVDLAALSECCRPQLLIADEPTTALDVTVQAEILRRFDRLQGQSGMAIILVTHNLAIAANHTDEVAVMYGGKIVEHAPTGVLFSRMRHPYTRTLMAAVPRLDAAAGEPFMTIEGRPPDLSNPPAGCCFADRCRYVRPLCHRAAPPLTCSDDKNHRFACFFPLDQGRV